MISINGEQIPLLEGVLQLGPGIRTTPVGMYPAPINKTRPDLKQAVELICRSCRRRGAKNSSLGYIQRTPDRKPIGFVATYRENDTLVAWDWENNCLAEIDRLRLAPPEKLTHRLNIVCKNRRRHTIRVRVSRLEARVADLLDGDELVI